MYNLREKLYNAIKKAEIPYEGVDISNAVDNCIELIEVIIIEKDEKIRKLEEKLISNYDDLVG